MKKYLSELFGTMFVVFFGCCAAVVCDGSAPMYQITVALSFALATYAFCTALAPKCDGYFNPALSVAMWFERRLDGRQVLGYILAQSLGAIIAAVILFLLVGSMPETSAYPFAAAAVSVGDDGYLSAFLAEVLLSLALTFAVLGSSRDGRPSASAYAAALGAAILVSTPISGGSLNPARALGPALLGGGEALSQLWLYIAAPISGAALAAGIWRLIDSQR